MKKRKMSALQRKYFGKRHRAVRHSKRRVVVMAKRRSYRGRARSYARKGVGGLKSMLAPIGAGIADSYLDPRFPIDGIGATAVGIFMHNPTVKDIGLYKVGMSIGNILPLPGWSGTMNGALI